MKKNKFILRRTLAFIVDYLLVFLTIVFASSYFVNNNTNEIVQEINDYGTIIIIITWPLYLIVFEQILGSTIGNKIAGLKVESLIGDKVSYVQSIKRHLLDFIDATPLGLIGLFTILYSKRNQRLGDMWAKTIVIKAKTI